MSDSTLIDRLQLPVVGLVVMVVVTLAVCGGASGNQPPEPNTVLGTSQEVSPLPSLAPAQRTSNIWRTDLASADDPQLRQLVGYESALHYRFSEEMYFTDMPRTAAEATSQAADMAGTLKEYSKYGIKPLIIMEPTNNDGENIPLNQLGTPGYANTLHTLFTGLKAHGITDEQMGTLVPVPEADLPKWGTHSTDPKLFGRNFAAIGGAYKRVFPKAGLSLLLDSTAYPNGDVNYEQGDTSAGSLMRYVNVLKTTPGMPAIDSIGFQGFPWKTTDNPEHYLDGTTAVALARGLGVKHIWFNTGTAESYNGHKVPAAIRRAQLLGELAQAKLAKNAGDKVRINLFAYEDPGIPWKYPVNPKTNVVSAPLPKFMSKAAKSGIDVDLFDQ